MLLLLPWRVAPPLASVRTLLDWWRSFCFLPPSLSVSLSPSLCCCAWLRKGRKREPCFSPSLPLHYQQLSGASTLHSSQCWQVAFLRAKKIDKPGIFLIVFFATHFCLNDWLTSRFWVNVWDPLLKKSGIFLGQESLAKKYPSARPGKTVRFYTHLLPTDGASFSLSPFGESPPLLSTTTTTQPLKEEKRAAYASGATAVLVAVAANIG